MAGYTPKKLKLLVKDQDDLALVSGLMQDALLLVQDMQIDLKTGSFIAVFSRFMWEGAAQVDLLKGQAQSQALSADEEPEDGDDARFEDVPAGDLASYHRVHSALRIEGVTAAQTRRLPSDPKANLSLLSIDAIKPDAVLLTFSQDTAIRLQVSDLRAALEDLGEPWPTLYRPDHDQAS